MTLTRPDILAPRRDILVEDRKSRMARATPKRLGMKYPDTVILEYPGEYGRRGRYHYTVRLKNLEPTMDADRITEKLFRRHARYFDPSKVKHEQVKRLVEKLIARSAADPPADPSGPDQNLGTARPPLVAPDVDLNKVSEFELAKAKALMDTDYTKNIVQRGDAGYVYDKEVDFDEQGDSDGSWD